MSDDAYSSRIEDALREATARAGGPHAPPFLFKALEHAVFPGGARIRPRLTLSVAQACGDDAPVLAASAAAAVELLHCASLVHDDMPCFDDAAMRRGRPSVHVAFGEPLALLAGDALIVLAFETAGRGGAVSPIRALALTGVLARAVGMPLGIVAGQGWESEPSPDIDAYQRAKTGALFAGAAMAGAVAAGWDAGDWPTLGYRLGEAYQVADDIRDVICSEEEIGKPADRDRTLGRPNVVHERGLEAAAGRLRMLVAEAIDSIPPCPGAAALRQQIQAQASRFLPRTALAAA
jgi:geranylgeranyl diphosphate synthase, type II